MIESSKKQKIDRIITPNKRVEDKTQNFTNILRPLTLDDYVGQELIKKHLSVSMASCKIRNCSLDHILFYGPPGL
jgi:Holliday junction DNA helicase RuvB